MSNDDNDENSGGRVISLNLPRRSAAQIMENPPTFPSHNPILDDKRQYILEQFIATAKAELDEYQKTWTDSNEYHRQPHTWNEWWKTFHRYMSW